MASLFYVERLGGLYFTWVPRKYWLGVPVTVLGVVAGATLRANLNGQRLSLFRHRCPLG